MIGFLQQRLRVLALLESRQSEGATTAEISHPAVGGHEGTRRLRELRELGYRIRAVPLPNGYWRYWLAQPDEVIPEQASLFGGDEDGDA